MVAILDTKNIVTIMTRHLPTVIAIYLFGSQAAGTQREDSDVDVAFLGADPVTGEMGFLLKKELSAALKKSIDLVELRSADTVTTAQVVSYGHLIYVADARTVAEFEVTALAKYVQLNEERKGIITDMLEDAKKHA